MFVSLLGVLQSRAQEFDDWEARASVTVKYKFNSKLFVAGTYFLNFEKQMRRYEKSVLGAEAGYKISSWMKAGIEYRFGIGSQKQDHDIRYALTFDYNSPSKKWNVALRPMVQQEFISLKKEKLATSPIDYYWRNKLTVSHDITRNLEFYIFTENYLKIEKGDLTFFRQMSGLGADFEINNQNQVGVRFDVINKVSGKMIARPNLSYTYSFGFRKQKK